MLKPNAALRVLCVLCAALAVALSVAHAQDQDLPPYLYYPTDGGYIIARADGTDSHIIVGDSRMSTAASWSPSGQWLAWITPRAGGCGAAARDVETLYIVSRSFSIGIDAAAVMYTWSPSGRDELFVITTDSDGVLRWRIFDPVLFEAPLLGGELTADDNVYRRLDQFFNPTPDYLLRPDTPAYDVLSADGRLRAYVYDGPVIVDVATGVETFVSPAVGQRGDIGGWVDWHPSAPWLLSIERQDSGCDTAYITQATNGETRYEIPGCTWQRVCAQWLPSRVDPAGFPGYRKPETPQPFAVLSADYWIGRLQWSDDGQTLYAAGEYDEASKQTAWDVDSGDVLPGVGMPPLPPEPTGTFGEGSEMVEILAESPRFVVTRAGILERETGAFVMNVPEAWFMTGGTLRFSADDTLMLTAGRYEPLRIWDMDTAALRFEGFTTTAAAFNPTADIVAVASGWDVRLYTREELGY